MTREARQTRCPETVLGWIPWYADGSLTDRQKGAVESHAAECAECRAELDMISGAPFEIDVELPDPDRVFNEITSRLRAEDLLADEGDAAQASVIPIERGRVLTSEDLGKIEEWILDPSSEEALEEEGTARATQEHDATATVIEGPWARSTIWAAAAALALLFVGGLGGSLLAPFASDSQAGANRAVYELSAAPATALLASAGVPMIEVVFVDSVSVLEISNMLRSLGVEIVSGPTNLGVYRLALTEAAAKGREPTAADAAAIAARLAAPESAVALYAEAIP